MSDELRQDDEFVPETPSCDLAEQPESDGAVPEAGSGDVLSALRRHWLVMVGICAATVALGGLYSYSVSRTYVATAELKVERFLPRMTNMAGVEGYGNQPYDYVLTQCQVIQSPRIISAALADRESSGMTCLAGRADPTRHVLECLKVQPKENSQVVELRLTWPDAAEAADLLNAIIDAYMKYSVARKHDTASEYVRSLRHQREQLKQELGRARQRVHAFMAQSGVVVPRPGGQDVVSAKLADLNRALTQAQIERIRHESRSQSLRRYSREQWRDVAVGQGDASRDLSPVRTQILQKRQELAGLRQRLGDAHPQIRVLKEELRVLVQAEDQSLLRAARGMMAQATEACAAAKACEQALCAAFQKQREVVLDQASNRSQYLTIRNDEERTRNVYQRVAQRIKELEVIGNEGVCNISVLSPAGEPLAPASPNGPRVMCVSALIGLGLGLAVVMVLSKPLTPGYVAYRSAVGPIGSPA